MNDHTLNVVLGASGGIGNAVARTLAAQGKRVRAVNRSGKADLPATVEVVRGDALDAASVRAACAGAGVVFNCVNVPYPEWEAKFPPMMQNITDAAAAVDAKLIFADNVYMYGPVSVPLTEDLPYAAPGHKGKLRARLANELMQAHASGKVRVAIGRASDFYGPGVTNALAGGDVFRAIVAGKQAMWAGSLDMPHTLTYIDDFARGLITLAERDDALGQTWHIAGAEPITARQFFQLAFEIAGTRAHIGVYSPWMIWLVGVFSPLVREVRETLYQFTRPFVVDGTKFARAFGYNPCTPHRQAIEQTIAWYRNHPK
ncbi:MAG: NAD-dependent epimerase/dehydratase family protein [Chloroflexi bacterium]|nr:NAD-dependent epimerase/dehydratase family protein [Chloroflexota bacterium]